MSTIRLVWKEILHRPVSFGLSACGVFVAVALFVFYQTAGEGSMRETTRTMRDLGMNVRIIPADTDMATFYAQRFSNSTMPQSYVDTMAKTRGLSYAHLLPRLQQRIGWQGGEVFIVGLTQEAHPIGRKKPSMSLEPKPGEVIVGSHLAASANLETGMTIDIKNKSFRVAEVLKEKGTQQDITFYAHLNDVQPMFNLEGRINEIQAIDCLCFDESKDTVEELRRQLKTLLPDVKVVRIQDMAEARRKQRYLVADYMAMIMPITLVLCAAWIGVLAMLNVRERRQEIGVLRALGYRSQQIATLFLLKAIVIGVIGAAAGFFIGTTLVLYLGDDVFEATSKKLRPMYDLLGWSLLVSPLFVAGASLIPTLTAVQQDPAVSLREE